MIASYLIFFIAGLGFGFAVSARWKWLPLLFPLALFLISAMSEGVDGVMVVRLVVALLVTGAGILVGALLERRGGERPGYA